MTKPSFLVREARSQDDVERIRQLILAHARERANTPGVEYMIDDAGELPGPYTPPRGALWLASTDSEGIGCVALKPLSESMGEIKRMYVESAWRGRGVGRALLESLISGARARRYRTLRLGTLDDMTAAQALYHSVGFTPIDRYRPDELVHTRFLELSLE